MYRSLKKLFAKKMSNIVEKTEALSQQQLEQLIIKSTYILAINIESQLAHDIADFEGGDTWYFGEYKINIEQQFKPIEEQLSWQSTTLSLPGTKVKAEAFDIVKVGEQYIAFYSYCAMANGYSLEGLMPLKQSTIEQIKLEIK